MVTFAKLEPDGRGGFRVVEQKVLKQATIAKCPHVIFATEHYREDGTCKCNDPDATEMHEWGYVWDATAKLWVSPESDK